MSRAVIPFLLKWIQAKDSPVKTKLRLWLARHPFLHLRITDDDQRHKQAMIGFWLLEDEGKPGWPVLIQWTEAADPERRFWAFDCLIESQADTETILPVLVRLSRDPDTLIHDYAARQFRRRYPLEAAAAGVANPPPHLQMFSSSLNVRTIRPVTNQTLTKCLSEWITTVEKDEIAASVRARGYRLGGREWDYSDRDRRDWNDASHAVQQIGSNAIPSLLKWARAKDSPFRKVLIGWLRNHPSVHIQINDAPHYHHMALTGFNMLKEKARPAWPGLVELTYSTDPNCCFDAFLSLAQSNPDKDIILPVLLRLIHGPHKGIQPTVWAVFWELYPKDAEAAGVYNIMPWLRQTRTNEFTTNHVTAK